MWQPAQPGLPIMAHYASTLPAQVQPLTLQPQSGLIVDQRGSLSPPYSRIAAQPGAPQSSLRSPKVVSPHIPRNDLCSDMQQGDQRRPVSLPYNFCMGQTACSTPPLPYDGGQATHLNPNSSRAACIR